MQRNIIMENGTLTHIKPTQITVEEIDNGICKEKLILSYQGKPIAKFYYNMRGYNQDFSLTNSEGTHFGFGGDRSKSEQVRMFKLALKEGFTNIKHYN